MRCTCGVERNGSISSVVFFLSAHRRKKCEQILQPCTQCSNWLICFSFLVDPKCLFVFVCFVFLTWIPKLKKKTQKTYFNIVTIWTILNGWTQPGSALLRGGHTLTPMFPEKGGRARSCGWWRCPGPAPAPTAKGSKHFPSSPRSALCLGEQQLHQVNANTSDKEMDFLAPSPNILLILFWFTVATKPFMHMGNIASQEKCIIYFWKRGWVNVNYQ